MENQDISITKNGGNVTISSQSDPANPTLTYSNITVNWARRGNNTGGTPTGNVITIDANNGAEKRNFSVTVTATTVENSLYDGTATDSKTFNFIQDGTGGTSNSLYLSWVGGTFQNNTDYSMGVNTDSQYLVCSNGDEGTSFTTQGTVASRTNGTLYVGAETRYQVPKGVVSFTIDGFPESITPYEYDNCYISIVFRQNETTRSISFSTTNPTLLTQSVDFTDFELGTDITVSTTINFVRVN